MMPTSNSQSDNGKFAVKYRLPTAIVLTTLLFLWASLRPLDVSHDTDLYVDMFNNYFSESGGRFSELLFGWIASALVVILEDIPNGREIGGRTFLVFIALIESILFFLILKRKKVAEAVLMAFGFGPLIFLDVIRQGLAMLLAGLFVLEDRSKKIYLIAAAMATHIVAAIALLRLHLNKKHYKAVFVSAIVLLIVVYVLQDHLQGRYDYYVRVGYFQKFEEFEFSLNRISILNIFVVIFFFFAGAIGGFSKPETAILVTLYLSSIIFPLMFRVYFFYFFVMACSRDMLMPGKRITHVLFNIGYAFILLRFAMNAFQIFDKPAI